jgi:hypothetical protein
MTRDEAIALGLELYNTGKPCQNRHHADRFTKSGKCIECVNTEGMSYMATRRKLCRLLRHARFDRNET